MITVYTLLIRSHCSDSLSVLVSVVLPVTDCIQAGLLYNESALTHLNYK